MTAVSHPAPGELLLALLLASMPALPLSASDTLAYWNLDTGTEGAPLSADASLDVVHSRPLLGYNETTSPLFSSDTATGRGLSLRANVKDAYTIDPEINNWAPKAWTIEISVKFDAFTGWNTQGWNTVIGRDGSSTPGPKSDFYFQRTGTSGRFRLDFAAADGNRYILDSDFEPVTGVWYHVALVSDGATVSMHVDRGDGQGYRPAASAVLNARPWANNALPASGFNWTFGRGWYDGKHVDNIVGGFDDIRLTSRALAPHEFLHAAAAAIELGRDGADVSLAWKRPSGAVRHQEIFRNGRVEPEGRERVALLGASAEIFLDRTPSSQTPYWYWLVVTREDGSTQTIGPVQAKIAAVWTP